ncbi:MAG: ATPase, T2SS/T4P/T4SS family [archaeon]
MVYIIDTSVVIEKAVSKMINGEKIKGDILLPRAVVARLEYEANLGREIGLLGLEELEELQNLATQGYITIKLVGVKPTVFQLKNDDSGLYVDSLVKDIAYDESASLITANVIQAQTAKAIGVNVIFIRLKSDLMKLEFEQFFDENTMSLHLKEDCVPLAKRGAPGNWNLEIVDTEKLGLVDVQRIAKEIVEKARIDSKAVVEISRKSSTIIQYQHYRIVIVKPPVSDGWEITIVRPIRVLHLEDYDLPKEIVNRMVEKAAGLVIAGETGSGKSTLVQAVAKLYLKEGRITKTIESPRDLILPNEVTQYSKNFADSEEIHDLLFLSRPDNLVFDEIRDTPDFKLFIDLRLGGSAVIGVVHSASAIDAVQRFLGRLDVGMIPSIVDTVIFVENGKVKDVLTLKMKIKVPSGMVEADLARPVVEIRDLLTNNPVYEIYTFGEETVILPIEKETKDNPVRNLAAKMIEKEILNYASSVEVTMKSDFKAYVYIPKKDMTNTIGEGGKTIVHLQRKLGISIELYPQESARKEGITLEYTASERANSLVFEVGGSGYIVDMFLDDEYLFTSMSGKNNEIKVNKHSDFGKKIICALELNKKIELKKISE